MSGVVRVRRDVLAEVSAQAGQTPQSECCGLLAASDGVITQVFPASNAASDTATSYEIAPEELLRLLRAIRAVGLTFAGIYHSHPKGASEPSARDVAQAFYPAAAYFIVSPQDGLSNTDQRHAVRAFSIFNGKVQELLLEIL